MAEEQPNKEQDGANPEEVATPEPSTPVNEPTGVPGAVETPAEETPATDPTPAAEEPSTDESPEEDASKDPKELGYNEYDHPALKQVVNILSETGLTAEESNAFFAEAVSSGDITKIDKDALYAKLGKDKGDVVLVLAESYYNTEFSKFKKVKDSVMEMVGGEDSFAAMQEWAATKASADPEFAATVQELRAMMNSGIDRSVKAAISDLFEMYKDDPDTTIPAELLKGDKPGSRTGVEPLSRQEYAREIERARKNGTYEKIRPTLWARRQAGVNKGI